MHHLLDCLAQPKGKLLEAKADFIEAVKQIVRCHVLKYGRLAPEDRRNVVANSAGQLHVDAVSMGPVAIRD